MNGPENLEKRTKGYQTLLDRWHGSLARIEEYRISHRVLTLLLSQDGRRGHLTIGAVDCSKVFFQPYWYDSAIAFALRPNGDNDWTYALWDHKADLFVVCGLIEISEHMPHTY